MLAPARRGRFAARAMPAIRALHRGDHDALRALYLGAPPEDRSTRFCAQVTDAQVARHVQRAVDRADELLGAFECGRLIGAAEVFVGEGSAELAFLVAHDAQHRGVGKALMRAALDAAERLRAHHAMVVTARDNRPMHRLALGAGMTRTTAPEDDWSAGIALPRGA